MVGRVAAMEDIALNYFILGINPKILTVLRCQNPKKINDALILLYQKKYYFNMLIKNTNKRNISKKVLPQTKHTFCQPRATTIP